MRVDEHRYLIITLKDGEIDDFEAIVEEARSHVLKFDFSRQDVRPRYLKLLDFLGEHFYGK